MSRSGALAVLPLSLLLGCPTWETTPEKGRQQARWAKLEFQASWREAREGMTVAEIERLLGPPSGGKAVVQEQDGTRSVTSRWSKEALERFIDEHAGGHAKDTTRTYFLYHWGTVVLEEGLVVALVE